MMSSAIDIDPTFKHALKLLHSANSDSAEKIRNLLDELIKQRIGGSKTLISTLSKKHLGEESLAPGSNLYVRKQKPAPVTVPVVTLPDSKQPSPAKSEPGSESVVPTPESLTVPPPSGPIILSLSDVEGNDEDDDVVMEEDQLKELEDLMCIVCRRMDVSARNRLVECADCHSLYHQECHKPVISEADASENAWFCTLCKGKSIGKSSSSSGSSSRKPETSSSSHSKSSSSKNYESSSSSSSSSKHKSSKSSRESSSHERDRSERSERDREKDKEKSSRSSSSSSAAAAGPSSSSSAAASSSSSSSASGAGTPNINIISADKRLQMMKKKAAKMHDSKRKHK